MHDNMYDLWGEYTIGGIKDFLIYIFVKLTWNNTLLQVLQKQTKTKHTFLNINNHVL